MNGTARAKSPTWVGKSFSRSFQMDHPHTGWGKGDVSAIDDHFQVQNNYLTLLSDLNKNVDDRTRVDYERHTQR